MKQPAVIYTIDESRIESAHDAMIAADAELRDHCLLINDVLEFIDALVRAEPHRDDGELVLLRLSVRCFNTIGAALRLVRCGYWQPAFALTRDLLETVFLLDFLSHDRAALTRWHTLPIADRKKAFSPVKVREALDTRDGFKERNRAKLYDLLSGYAAHATPEGFVVISPEAMTQVGPFPSDMNLRAALQELVKQVVAAGDIIRQLVPAELSTTRELKEKLHQRLAAWWRTYGVKPTQA